MTDKPEVKPYRWKRTRGPLQMWMLRDYAAWLFPQVSLPWESPGVRRIKDPARDPDTDGPEVKPYRFPKSEGPCLMKDLVHFGDYVLKMLPPLSQDILITDVGTQFEERTEGPLRPEKERERYQWPTKVGLAFVRHLKHLAAHIDTLLRKRETPRQDIEYGTFG